MERGHRPRPGCALRIAPARPVDGRRGYLYYLHKKPKSSPLGSLIAFQRAIEPRAQYVVQAEQVNQEVGEEGASGQADPDGPNDEAMRRRYEMG